MVARRGKCGFSRFLCSGPLHFSLKRLMKSSETVTAFLPSATKQSTQWNEGRSKGQIRFRQSGFCFCQPAFFLPFFWNKFGQWPSKCPSKCLPWTHEAPAQTHRCGRGQRQVRTHGPERLWPRLWGHHFAAFPTLSALLFFPFHELPQYLLSKSYAIKNYGSWP